MGIENPKMNRDAEYDCGDFDGDGEEFHCGDLETALVWLYPSYEHSYDHRELELTWILFYKNCKNRTLEAKYTLQEAQLHLLQKPVLPMNHCMKD